MNTELKAILSVLFSAIKVVEDVVGKVNIIGIFPDLLKLGEAIPAAVSDWGDLLAELEVIYQPANIADLVAFIESQFSSIVSDAKSKAIVSAITKIVLDNAHDVSDLLAIINAPGKPQLPVDKKVS